jgi:hypothetical protein
VNLVDVKPDKDVLKVLRISRTPKDLGFTRVVHVINTFSRNFVSTPLSSEYGDLKPGVYIASIGRSVDKDVLKDELQNAFGKYFQEIAHRGSMQSSQQMDNIVKSLIDATEEEQIPSTSYVVANLLGNLLEKIVPSDIKCHEKGVKVCVQLDKDMLEAKLRESERVLEPLFGFCQEYPNLCGEGDDGCARFFTVVKQFHIRFQHSVSNDRERIYMIFFSSYRRLSSLELKRVVDFLKNDVKLHVENINNVLKGVRVNVALPQGSVLCEIKDVGSKEGDDVLELKCISEELKELGELKIHYNELDMYNVRINPTYRISRKFISNHLCKYFDEHKRLSWFTPSVYFKILENDLKIFKKLLAGFALPKIVLGNVIYTIGDSFVGVLDAWS